MLGERRARRRGCRGLAGRVPRPPAALRPGSRGWSAKAGVSSPTQGRLLSRLSALFVHTCFLRLLELDRRLLARETHSYDMLRSWSCRSGYPAFKVSPGTQKPEQVRGQARVHAVGRASPDPG